MIDKEALSMDLTEMLKWLLVSDLPIDELCEQFNGFNLTVTDTEKFFDANYKCLCITIVQNKDGSYFLQDNPELYENEEAIGYYDYSTNVIRVW